MKTFKDVPEWYLTRIRKMYGPGTPRVCKCSQYLERNHLLPGCVRCAEKGIFPIKSQQVALEATFDRLYITQNVYEKFCLKRLCADRRLLYTSLEFPTPKITSQSITRIPQFYEPTTGLIIDCFKSEDELAAKSSPYFINKANRVCQDAGLHYCQLIVNRKQVIQVYRQPIAGFDEVAYKLLEKYNESHNH